MNDLDLLALQAATNFVLSESGGILCCNSPDRATPPRLYLAGCTSGNVLRIRYNVAQEIATAIERLAADEPPLRHPDSAPFHLEDYLRLLGTEAPVEHHELGLIWTFPDRLDCEHPAKLVASDTPEGADLLGRLTEQGMPEALAAAGFVDVGEFWAPWCIAFHGDDIASIAFAARLGPESAETGVYTLPALRGRGFAAAATAGWASVPALRGRTLFYSTSRANASSQRVSQRLGLRFIGARLDIT